jgi:hypothetical protein
MLTDYTTYDNIRATLGVSETEIEDSDLGLEVWSSVLATALDEFSAVLVTTYESIAEKAEIDRSANEQKVYISTRLFATYAVANELLASLPMFSFKRLTDGKAETERFDAWKDTKAGVQSSLAAVRLRLQLALSNVSDYTAPTRSSFKFVTSTGLAVNPVTE